jgi:hypothetical protein|uniref:Uncharacterized protein n=1 Tax=Zea mays TaxID=4577 RepID=A0A804Q842_MAIZE
MRVVARDGQPHGINVLDIWELHCLLSFPHHAEELAIVLRSCNAHLYIHYICDIYVEINKKNLKFGSTHVCVCDATTKSQPTQKKKNRVMREEDAGHLDDEEVGPAEVAANVTHESLHPPLVELSILAPHGVRLPLVPKQGGQVTASAALGHGRPGARHHPLVQLRPPGPVGDRRAALRARHESDDDGGLCGCALAGEHGVREGHAGPDAENVAHVDAGVQRLARLLPAKRRGETDDAVRGRALRRDDAVPGAVGGAAAAAHVGLPSQDEHQCPAAGQPSGRGGEEEEQEEGYRWLEREQSHYCPQCLPACDA